MVEEQPSSIILPKYLQEDELSEDVRVLLSTLPTDKGWFVNNIYQYQGFWNSPKQLQGLLNCQKHFQAQDTDILLATQPKSGTTWLKALAFSLINRNNKYPITLNNQDHPLFTNNPHTLVPFLEFDIFHLKDVVPDLSAFSSPRLFATHLPYVLLPESMKNSNCKIVYLCRDPKDNFISLWHFSNALRRKGSNSLDESFDKFCRGINVGGPFWDHILSYWKESLVEKPNNKKVMFLRFEELKMNTSFVLKNLAEFLGCPFSKEEENQGLMDDILKLCSFENLRNLEVNKNGKRPSGIENKAYFRRGEIGDWKNHLSVEMIERLNEIVEQKMGTFGFRF
ncbi:hypothetical protein PIB30_074406 [Stylosanthes scabra]|uniref:Sulfotransferase n=1 Tax=Stylosanthes scabra TaxID=79078 RepID=A0ABU6RPS7_9FABA|nr:hypothetical protein [Stylosanthes scabra]